MKQAAVRENGFRLVRRVAPRFRDHQDLPALTHRQGFADLYSTDTGCSPRIGRPDSDPSALCAAPSARRIQGKKAVPALGYSNASPRPYLRADAEPVECLLRGAWGDKIGGNVRSLGVMPTARLEREGLFGAGGRRYRRGLARRAAASGGLLRAGRAAARRIDPTRLGAGCARPENRRSEKRRPGDPGSYNRMPAAPKPPGDDIWSKETVICMHRWD